MTPTKVKIVGVATASKATRLARTSATVGAVISLGDPIPDSWALVVFWAVVAVMVARADNETLARTTVAPVPAGLRVAHGVSALSIPLARSAARASSTV